jgi:hypothetical protein
VEWVNETHGIVSHTEQITLSDSLITLSQLITD